MRARLPLRPNGGAALLLVVLLVALLAVMVVEFQREARLSLQSAGTCATRSRATPWPAPEWP